MHPPEWKSGVQLTQLTDLLRQSRISSNKDLPELIFVPERTGKLHKMQTYVYEA